MSMTKEERDTKNFIAVKLQEEGYVTYARIFSKLDLHLTNSPMVVGHMTPENGTITINRNLDEEQFSVIIRHEILHSYLQHEKRLLDHLAQQRGIDPDTLDDLSLNELKQYLYGNKLFNIAADYEISNRGYTEEDKDTVRNILLNGKTLSGLVTEDDHPEWVNWDVEDMYDALIQEKEKAEREAQRDMNNQQNSQQASGERNSSDEDDDEDNDPSGGQQSQSGQDDNSSGDDNGGSSGNEAGDQQSQDSKSSAKNKSGKSSNNSDDLDDDDTSDGSDSADTRKNRPIVYGRFINDHTFIDEYGNEITVEE